MSEFKFHHGHFFCRLLRYVREDDLTVERDYGPSRTARCIVNGEGGREEGQVSNYVK